MDRISFVVEYFDPQAAMLRKYNLCFYPADSTVEMFDLKNNRVFLKRCPYPSLAPRDLFIGANITVFSRALKLVDFGDDLTRRHLSSEVAAAAVLIGAGAFYKAGAVLSEIIRGGDVHVADIRLCVLPASEAREVGAPSERFFFVDVRGAAVAEKARAAARQAAGVGADGAVVCIEASEEPRLRRLRAAIAAARPTATLRNCAVLVVKPHAVTAHGGAILQRVLDEGFEVTAMATFSLSRADAEDFLEVYAGVVPEHKKLVEHLASGQLWALEVKAENSVAALRALCGPHDPDIARVLFPQSLRAVLGEDRVRNAVHCTDLPEDGVLESEFFFQLLAQQRA
jgi:nucleoside-diphosphate kinase